MIDINTLSTNPRRIWCHIQIFVLAIFLTILQPASSVAQVGTLFNYTRNRSSSYVNHVYQDRQGFIWVSTQNGLNRYDGYSFYTYTTNEGLPIDNIICVIQDKNNLIYVGTTSGLYVKIGGKFRAANLLKVPRRAVAGLLSVADVDLVAVVVPAVPDAVDCADDFARHRIGLAGGRHQPILHRRPFVFLLFCHFRFSFLVVREAYPRFVFLTV